RIDLRAAGAAEALHALAPAVGGLGVVRRSSAACEARRDRVDHSAIVPAGERLAVAAVADRDGAGLDLGLVADRAAMAFSMDEHGTAIAICAAPANRGVARSGAGRAPSSAAR